jgi:hypothetical protein
MTGTYKLSPQPIELPWVAPVLLDRSKPTPPIEVWCPACHASPGERCSTPLGFHRDRFRYARKEF